MTTTDNNTKTVFAPAPMERKRNGARIIIAGGGTGGHIFPAVAVANALKELDENTTILFVGANGKMEMEKIPEAGYNIKGIDISGFNRSSLFSNVSLPFKIVRSFFQVRGILKAFQPDAVFGVGGYSSFPVLRLAQTLDIPTFLHESNAFAGKSNMLLGHKAKKIFVAAEGMQKFFPANKIVITGNPVRSSIADNVVDPVKAKHLFGLQDDKITVFAMGGSLGARSINEAIDAGIDKLLQRNIQLIWQTGKLYIDRAKEVVENKSGVWANDFISGMENAYAAADIVISRSGAMSVTELCISGKPVVFVPYPFAAEDHQTANAKALVDKDAAIMIKDADAKTKLIDEVTGLAKDASKRLRLAGNIKKLAVKDADIQIAKMILENI
jgi:UDP-N-acetylglucosamine--N-acetylmuramyl-(pentapeptide) pyrophosphoryl-undecaprenol N-acetylglucosamine transferase